MRPSTITKRPIDEEEGPHAVPPRGPRQPRNPLWKRKTASVSRWLHIYLSMVSFVILFFFAATGLTVNHQQWFAKQQKTVQYKGTLDTKWVGPGDPANIAKMEVVEYLRTHHKISSAVSEFRVDDAQCSVSFKGPGYAADVFIDRATGAYDVTETKMGMAAVLNDLHKGRDAGHAWGVVIDISAIFMTLVSITGLVMICFMQKRRFSGLMATVVGAALCLAVYWIWVP